MSSFAPGLFPRPHLPLFPFPMNAQYSSRYRYQLPPIGRYASDRSTSPELSLISASGGRLMTSSERSTTPSEGGFARKAYPLAILPKNDPCRLITRKTVTLSSSGTRCTRLTRRRLSRAWYSSHCATERPGPGPDLPGSVETKRGSRFDISIKRLKSDSCWRNTADHRPIRGLQQCTSAHDRRGHKRNTCEGPAEGPTRVRRWRLALDLDGQG
jgi:hypothetical protein